MRAVTCDTPSAYHHSVFMLEWGGGKDGARSKATECPYLTIWHGFDHNQCV